MKKTLGFRRALWVVKAPAPKGTTQEDLFVACEEDRPVLVAVRYRKRESLLDPDCNLIESFEP